MKLSTIAKIRLKPDEEQSKKMVQTGRAYNKLCQRISSYCYNEEIYDLKSLRKNLSKELKKNFPVWMINSAIKQVAQDYEIYFSDQERKILIKYQGASYCLPKRSYALGECVSVSTLDGKVNVDYEIITEDGTGWREKREAFSIEISRGNPDDPSLPSPLVPSLEYVIPNDGNEYVLDDAILINRKGIWTLYITCITEYYGEIAEIVGIDIGINNLAVTYDSSGKCTFYSGRNAKQERAKRNTKRKELVEHNIRVSKQKVKEFNQKECEWMGEVNQGIIKEILSQVPQGTLFVIENLQKNINKQDETSQTFRAYKHFRQELEQRAKAAGCKVLAVDPAFTSQKCPRCGHIEKANRNRSAHTFRCKECGYTSNDDRIGAMNLFQIGALSLLRNLKKNRACHFRNSS